MPKKSNKIKVAVQVEGDHGDGADHQTSIFEFTLENGQGQEYLHLNQVGEKEQN